jgi:hypothetical protein
VTASISVTKSKLSITANLVPSSGSVHDVQWNFGDGSSMGSGNPTSHTYAAAGSYSIIAIYLDGEMDSHGASTSVTVSSSGKDPSGDYSNTDIFNKKPIIIPKDCTGDITLSASIQDLDTPDSTNKTDYSSSLAGSITLTGVTLAGTDTIEYEFDYTTTMDSTISGATVSKCKLDVFEYIPAFYGNCSIAVEGCYYETEDEDSKCDVTFDFKMAIYAEVLPSWYETSLQYDKATWKKLIKSSNTEAYFTTMGENTTHTQYFTIDSFSQLPPFIIKDYFDEQATTTVTRAVLPPPKFKLILTNNLASSVTLSSIVLNMTWNYSPNGTLMNMTGIKSTDNKSAVIMTLPKGSETGRISSLNYPVYAVVQGYTISDPPVKMWAQWNEYYSDGDYYYPTVVPLTAVSGTSSSDYATCLYSTAANDDPNPLTSDDFIRIVYNDWMDSDGIIARRARDLAAMDHYRNINVKVKDASGNDGYNPDATDAVFVIETTPNDTVDDYITESDLTTYISTIHYYNVAVDFSNTISINRSSIDPVFRETLWSTYDKSAVLESITQEPLYYINFTINGYAQMVPIMDSNTYSGSCVKFSDSLSHAIDGVRSSDIFYMDGKTNNVINVQSPTKDKYKVKFKVDYDIYQNIYVATDDDA